MKAFERTLVILVVLVVGVPVTLIALVAVWLHFAWAPPDIHRQIRSADFQQRHTAAVADTDQAAVTFFTTAPHGTRLATSVRDHCQAFSHSFGTKPTTECVREVVLYMAFNGDQVTLQRAWGRKLDAAGWPGPTFDLPSNYYSLSSAHGAARVTWHTRPQTGAAGTDFQKGVPDTDHDEQVTLDQKPIDVADVYQDGYAQNRYVVEIAVDESYFPGRPLPAHTPARGGNGCFGGHGNCPGG